MKSPHLSETEFASIADLVRTRTGLAFAPSRRSQAEACIRQTMEAADAKNTERFLQLIRTHDGAFQTLVESLTVAETYFFREREQFEMARRLILPELRRRVLSGGGLRLWSAGCATGEEPYSLAILLEQEGLAGQASVIATDISRSALARARKGAYGAWSFRGNQPAFIDQYFRRQGETFILIDRIRQAVAFDTVNIAADAYPASIAGMAGFDLIMCRNVLIYFDPDAVARVARQMFAALKDGGWLIAGPSDPPLWQHAPYETVLTPAGVLYRRNGHCERPRPPQQCADSGLPLPAAHLTQVAGGKSAPAVERPASLVATARKPTPPRRIPTVNDVRSKPKPAMTPDDLASLQTLSNQGDPQRALSAVSAAVAAQPLSAEAHFFHAIALMNAGRHDDAATALRHVIYLDRSMALAHFTLASILQRRGAMAEARRSFRNVLAVCDLRRADEIVPFSEGEDTARLVEAARAQLALMRDGAGQRS